MAEEEYIVLYTAQKIKKAKTWHDGALKIMAVGTKAVLYDDKRSRLDTVFVRAADVILGEQIESDRYLILIEEKKSANPTTNVQPDSVVSRSCVGQSVSAVRCGIPSVRGRGQGGGGLKRKRTGFVPPRMMKVAEEANIPSTETQSTHPSQACHSNLSPLQGMTGYKASIMKLYSRNTKPQNVIQESSQEPTSHGALFSSSHPRNEYGALTSTTGPHVSGKCQLTPGQGSSAILKYSSTGDGDKDVSPQLNNFMSKLRNRADGAQESSPSRHAETRDKSSPWTTFGCRKSDSGSQGSQSSEDNTLNKPVALSVSPVTETSSTDVISNRKNEARRDIIVQKTILKDCDMKEQQIDLQNNAARKRTTNQIMALLRGTSCSNVGKQTNQHNEQDPETCESLISSEQYRNQDQVEEDPFDPKQPGRSVGSEFYSRESALDLGVTDHVMSVDNSQKQDAMSDLMESGPKNGEDSEQLDPFETSDATFDINFSPLSHVSSSDDETVTEQVDSNVQDEHGDRDEKFDDTHEQIKSKGCSDSVMEEVAIEAHGRDSLIGGTSIGSLVEIVAGNHSSVININRESDFRIIEPPKGPWMPGADLNMCPLEDEFKEIKSSVPRQESAVKDQGLHNSQNGRLAVNQTTPETRSNQSQPEVLSPRPVQSSTHPLNDLQFSPDSFDLNTSLSQLSQSGFLETLSAASNKARNLVFSTKSSEAGSAFDDKPSKINSNKHRNTSSDTSDLKHNQQMKEFESNSSDISCSQKVGESVDFLQEKPREQSESQRVSPDLSEKIQDGCGTSKQIVIDVSEKNVSDTFEMIMPSKNGSGLLSANNKQKAGQETGAGEKSATLCSYSQMDFSNSSRQDTTSKAFTLRAGSEETEYRFPSSSESCLSAVVPIAGAGNILHHNKSYELESDFLGANSSYPIPDTPNIVQDDIQSSGDTPDIVKDVNSSGDNPDIVKDDIPSSGVGKVLRDSFSNDSSPDSFNTDNNRFCSSTQRQYATSESMISVPVIDGHKPVFQSTGMDDHRSGGLLDANEDQQAKASLLRHVVGSFHMASPVDNILLPKNKPPRPVSSVSSLPHPSWLCGDSRSRNSQAGEEKNISQLAARHLEGYTIKGMMSGGVVRREMTHPLPPRDSQGKVKVPAPFGRTSRVTSSQLQQALDTITDSQRQPVDQSAENFQFRFQPDRNCRSLSQEEFKLKINGDPDMKDRCHTDSARHLQNERFAFCKDSSSLSHSSTPVLSGRRLDEGWLVHDSQSSTSTTDLLPISGRLPIISVLEPTQQLHPDSLSQDDTEENFYVDWNEGKPKFVSKPISLEKGYKQMDGSPECQNVPLSPCVTSISSSSDVSQHGVHTVPQGIGETVKDYPLHEEWEDRETGFNVTVPCKQPRRPLRTNPVEDVKQEGYEVYTQSSGKTGSVPAQSDAFVRKNENQSNTFHDQPMSEDKSVGYERYCVKKPNNFGKTISNERLYNGDDGDEMKTVSDTIGKSQTSRLRTTCLESNMYRDRTESPGTDQTGGRCYRYTGSVRWQQSRQGHQEEEENDDQVKKGESRWGRYLQEEDDLSQVDREFRRHGRFVETSIVTQAPFEGNGGKIQSQFDGNHFRFDELRKSTSENHGSENFCGRVPSHDSSSLQRPVNDLLDGLDIAALDFDDSFDETFNTMKEHQPLTHQGKSLTVEEPSNKLSHRNNLRLPTPEIREEDQPLTDVSKSPDLFPTQRKERNPLSSRFTTPRFIDEDITHAKMKHSALVSQDGHRVLGSISGKPGKFRTPVADSFSNSVLQGTQRNLSGELQFPPCCEVEANVTPVRQVSIPVRFQNAQTYKQVISAALKEHLNIMLFDLARLYHTGLGKVDVSQYGGLGGMGSSKSSNPACKCGVPSKMIQVKKDGQNKGRFFYACEAPRNQQCKWMDLHGSTGSRKEGGTSVNRATLSSADSITAYIRGHGVTFYCECQYLLKYRDNYTTPFRKGIPAWVRQRQEQNKKKCMYIKLNRKDASSFFSKDDLWVISQTLMFEQGTTFVARSSYFGPNSGNEVEIEPISGYSPSNWTNNADCHAILAGNASMELACLVNLEEHVLPSSLPILPHLLDRASGNTKVDHIVHRLNTKLFTPGHFVMSLAETYVRRYQLNEDQAEAMMRVATMMNKDIASTDQVLLIHGVFGAGKSFLLSVIIRFLVEVFEKNDSYTPDVPFPWKLLISSTTNVAVDRVLMGLLDLGFEDFIRVGSVKKIAKPVLPYSVHASGSDSQELKDLQQMLRSDIPPSEKQLVRRSIEKHRLGENKKKLGGVRVVGVTCAACSFNCLNKIHFPFVVLDECSQMTEPASMLPVAKFSCEKLVLVGDPKQLDPTIQGSEAGHSEGLEQTLFDRMIKLDYSPVLLRKQYRCHPWISCIANTLFYNGQLQDGVTLENRAPLTPLFPTLCFYDVSTGDEQTDGSGSYYNVAEAQLVVMLIQGLVVEGVDAGSIGVITLYKAQMFKIITTLHTDNPNLNKELKRIQVSTVDAFQGGERDVIILSCVRTNNFGFIDNDKRTNVALTRARHHLLIAGHQRNLSRNKLWSRVIQHCRDRPGGVQSSAIVTSELHRLVEEKLSQQSETVSSQEGGPSTGQGRKRRAGKRKRGKKEEEEDSPPMSLSGGETENSGQSIQLISQPDVKSGEDDRPGSTLNSHAHDDVLDADDFVLTESKLNIPNNLQVRKRQKRSHLLNPDVFMDGNQHSSDEDLPTFI